ncbi:DUF3298 domain-containing protein [Williamsia sp. CHRR-6]|nr:DUF3298 domain-containing protein [Williamsia sp. CHRR-6]
MSPPSWFHERARASATNAGGIEPREENFANWTASPQGMQIHFLDYQLGGYALGRIDITIPWVRLADVLAPGMLEVVSS